MEGIVKVIDELGQMILTKDVELEDKRRELEELRQKVILLESYLDVYDEYYGDVE